MDFKIEASGAEIGVKVSHRSVYLSVLVEDIDDGDYADAYLAPDEARQLAAALGRAAARAEMTVPS